MTIERAAELVKALTGEAKTDLFTHFWDVFKLDRGRGSMFARLCGYDIATAIKEHK